jgi:hypothetical protein
MNGSLVCEDAGVFFVEILDAGLDFSPNRFRFRRNLETEEVCHVHSHGPSEQRYNTRQVNLSNGKNTFYHF